MQRPAPPLSTSPAVDIDLDAVCANYRTLKTAAPSAEMGAVVKCDAYGLGARAVARTLAERENCKTFFVAYPDEGAQLRVDLADIAPTATIYVFNGPHAETLQDFHEHKLTPILNSVDQARAWVEAFKGSAAALHIDTGMNRLGAPLDDVENIAAMRGLKITLVMSHLACASEPGNPMNDRQRTAFIEAAAHFPSARKSLSASGGAFMGKAFHFDLIRPGIALYGASPYDRPDPRLQPVARLSAPVIQIRRVTAGETAGYGAAHAFKHDAVLATVALGYGDGFLRAAGDRGAAFVGDAICPIAGRVSMDLIILDVTKAPQTIEIGERAEFFGRHIPIEDAAAAANTIGYELLTGLGARLTRRYVSDGRPGSADEPAAKGKSDPGNSL